MRLTASSILRAQWLVFAASMPLFSVEFLRINNESLRIHIAVPMVLLALIILTTLAFSAAGMRLRRVSNGGMLALLAGAFLVWHVFAIGPSEDPVVAVREVYKLLLGLLCLWAVSVSFPREPEFAVSFWEVAIAASTILMIGLIWQYYFVFHSPYLSNNLDEQTKYGRNQLTAYIVYVFPYAIARFACSPRLRGILEPLVLAAALVYAASRAAWISSAVGIGFLLYSTARDRGLARTIGYAIAAAVVVGSAIAVLYACVQDFEAPARLLYLFDPAAVPELNSYHERSWRALGGVHLFLESPLRGVGLANSNILLGTLTHNDYSAILAELGAIGFVLFIAIMFLVARNLFGMANSRADSVSWPGLGARMSYPAVACSLLFTNSYTTPLLWIFFGLCLAQADSDWRQGAAPAK